MQLRRVRARYSWLLAAPVFFSTGCVVIPIGDLLRPSALEEQVLVRGRGLFSKEKIAILTIRGQLSGAGRGGGARSLFGGENTVEEVKAQLDRLRKDSEMRAVVLRIASSGGEVTACDVIYHELLRFKKATNLPLIASIGSQAASGGYYIAMAADRVYAHPTSIVGSIGVILQHFDASQLLEKVGVRAGPIKSGEKKDLNSFLRPQTADERTILQQLVDDMYARFVDVVEAGRPEMTREEVLSLADGRVVSGSQAEQLGLVDGVGYLEDALEAARELAGVRSPTYVRYARSATGGGNIYSSFDDQVPAADFELSLQGSWNQEPRLLYLWKP